MRKSVIMGRGDTKVMSCRVGGGSKKFGNQRSRKICEVVWNMAAFYQKWYTLYIAILVLVGLQISESAILILWEHDQKQAGIVNKYARISGI